MTGLILLAVVLVAFGFAVWPVVRDVRADRRAKTPAPRHRLEHAHGGSLHAASILAQANDRSR